MKLNTHGADGRLHGLHNLLLFLVFLFPLRELMSHLTDLNTHFPLFNNHVPHALLLLLELFLVEVPLILCFPHFKFHVSNLVFEDL